MRLPEELIGKQNRTLEEEALYREHCRYGFSILISHKDLHTSAADVAYSHHEHVDGTGYPRGFTGDQLSLFARVVAICNAYDEITVDGVEGAVLDASQAIDYLRRYAGTRYDAELVAAFADCIGRYPSGCVVELRNGCIGLVVKQNRQHRDLPSVLVVRGADKQPCPESMVDLGRLALSGEGSPLKVASVLPNGAHGVRLEDYVKKGLRLS
jgi:HD-GYP domain-containing protein (c-di-GMP phosphodiesterase class II)